MPTEPPSAAELAALGTEYSALQSAAGSTVLESSSRSTAYLSSLASGLVAIGFASSSPAILAALAATVFPTVFLLGWFTVVRLTDTSIEAISARHRIARIRAVYAGFADAAIFAPDGVRSTGALGVHYNSWSILYTAATMIGLVNSVLAGAGSSVLLSMVLGLPVVVAIVAGAAVGAGFLAGTIAYVRRRINRVAQRDLED